MNKIIIGLVGEKLSGKGTAAEYFQKDFGGSIHKFSTSMRDCVKRLHLPVSRENLITFSEITRKAFGEDLYAKVIAGDSRDDTSDFVIVDGIRREADITELRKLDNFHLVYVTAPAEMRYKRMQTRGENVGETDMSWEDFMEEEHAPTEVAIPILGAEAEHRIDNDGTVEEFHEALERVVNEIRNAS